VRQVDVGGGIRDQRTESHMEFLKERMINWLEFLALPSCHDLQGADASTPDVEQDEH